MKIRIIGSIIFILVMAGLYVLTIDEGDKPTHTSPSTSNDSALKSLTIQ